MDQKTEFTGTSVNFPEDSNEDNYFQIYDQTQIHKTILSDKIRTGAFHEAIVHNKHLFKNKIVLDVGCGTGILSMFAAKAGAKKCFAVEASAIAHNTKEVVEINGFSDVISVIHGTVETVELPCDHVDIIISEWMGLCLFSGNMIESLIFARDKWLRPGGLIFPDLVKLFMLGSTEGFDPNFDLGRFESLYGLKLGVLPRNSMSRALCVHVDENTIATSKCLLAEFDLHTIRVEDVDFRSRFVLPVWGYFHEIIVRSMIIYFDVFFSRSHKPTWFSTGPISPVTHWKQTALRCPNITRESGDELTGFFELTRNKKIRRFLNLTLEVDDEEEPYYFDKWEYTVN